MVSGCAGLKRGVSALKGTGGLTLGIGGRFLLCSLCNSSNCKININCLIATSSALFAKEAEENKKKLKIIRKLRNYIFAAGREV